MKTLLAVVMLISLALLTTGFKMSGHGENYPTVQSAPGGVCYVRTTPDRDYGDEGKTQIFRVGKNGDELLDEYPVYMRGDVYLGWSPSLGKWCLVHLEPERITSNDDMAKVGKISRLAFYMGGKNLIAYSRDDLEKLGVYRRSGQCMIRGIQQVPWTNDYVFVIEKITANHATETVSLDITTGKPLNENSKSKPGGTND